MLRPQGKRHEDRIALIILILDLGLGQRGLLNDAPHDRLGAPVELVAHCELHDLARDLSFRRESHGGIRMVPVADDAEALELLALDAEPMLRECPTLPAERHEGLGVRQVRLRAALGPVLLLDLPLDGQAMAVPARHVIGVEAEHLLGARHEVLQDLVERVSDVDVAVGIRRAVMQHELGSAARSLAQALVETEALPAREDLRLLLWQASPHGKGRLGQEQRLGIIQRLVG
jgi:hypothetical protein